MTSPACAAQRHVFRTCLVSLLLAHAGAQAAGDDSAMVAAGLRILNDRGSGNCSACHALPGQTGVLSSLGPSLDKVGARLDAATLRQWVMDARQLKPDTLMPPFGTVQGTLRPNATQALLSSEQITQVVAALQSFR